MIIEFYFMLFAWLFGGIILMLTIRATVQDQPTLYTANNDPSEIGKLNWRSMLYDVLR